MTEFTIFQTVVSGIVVVLVAAASVIFITIKITDTETKLKTSTGEIWAANAAHLVKSCLETGDEIPESLLESSRGKEICGICGRPLVGFCRGKGKLGFKTRDFESGMEWNFGYTGEGRHNAELFVNIADGSGNTNLGRLYAEV